MRNVTVATLTVALLLVPLESVPIAARSDFRLDAPLNRDGPTITVVVAALPTLSNWHYEVRLTTATGIDQRFSVRNGQPIGPDAVRLVDLTADGFLDLMIVGGKDHRREDWYKTWVYEPDRNRFRWINDPR